MTFGSLFWLHAKHVSNLSWPPGLKIDLYWHLWAPHNIHRGSWRWTFFVYTFWSCTPKKAKFFISKLRPRNDVLTFRSNKHYGFHFQKWKVSDVQQRAGFSINGDSKRCVLDSKAHLKIWWMDTWHNKASWNVSTMCTFFSTFVCTENTHYHFANRVLSSSSRHFCHISECTMKRPLVDKVHESLSKSQIPIYFEKTLGLVGSHWRQSDKWIEGSMHDDMIGEVLMIARRKKSIIVSRLGKPAYGLHNLALNWGQNRATAFTWENAFSCVKYCKSAPNTWAQPWTCVMHMMRSANATTMRSKPGLKEEAPLCT